MKRHLARLLVATLAVCLAACGSEGPDESDPVWDMVHNLWEEPFWEIPAMLAEQPVFAEDHLLDDAPFARVGMVEHAGVEAGVGSAAGSVARVHAPLRPQDRFDIEGGTYSGTFPVGADGMGPLLQSQRGPSVQIPESFELILDDEAGRSVTVTHGVAGSDSASVVYKQKGGDPFEVKYDITSLMLKQTLTVGRDILGGQPVGKEVVLRERLQTAGIAGAMVDDAVAGAEPIEGREVVLHDEAGQPVFRFPRAIALEAGAIEDGAEREVLAGFYRVTFVDGVVDVDTVFDGEWFRKAERQWPVALDPSIQAIGTCSDDLGCDDGDDCTEDRCVTGVCDYRDTCMNACTSSSQCNDGNVCTSDSCVFSTVYTCYWGLDYGRGYTNGCYPPCFTTLTSRWVIRGCYVSVGACQHSYTYYNSCYDGNNCTVGDYCYAGTCRAGAVNCNDGNACTGDYCSGVNCAHYNISCNDGNACTSDWCSTSSGCGHSGISCNDGNVCTNDSCNASIGCVFSPNSIGCSDGNNCTKNDYCFAGSCRAGTYLTCNDGNTCTDDYCSTSTGNCVYAADNTNTCTDGNSCTTDYCSSGNCISNAIVCNDGNPCTNDYCSGGSCQISYNSNTCNDGNSCSHTDKCVSGVCKGTTYSCNDGLSCTYDACNGSGGCSNVTLPGYCKIDGICRANGAGNPSNQCQQCNTSVSTSAWSAKTGAACNDGNSCSYNDKCTSGSTCVGTTYSCNDGKACTTDSCNGSGGCGHSLISGYCDISNTCYSNGQENPGNKCLKCNTSSSTSSWSNNTEGLTFGTCNTGMKGECAPGQYECQNGVSYCVPAMSDYGAISTVSVPRLYERSTGNLIDGSSQLTSDGRYLYSVAYGVNGSVYGGFSYRKYDPRANFAVVLERKVVTPSFYMDGVVADENYIYPIEWTGGIGQVWRITTSSGALAKGWTVPQSYPGVSLITGQYDWVNDKVWMGALQNNAIGRWSHGSTWAPTASSSSAGNWDTFFGISGAAGAGVIGADGTYLYVKRWSSYAGDDVLRRIGSGYNGTTQGAYYGTASDGAMQTVLDGAYLSDGYFYQPNGGDLSRLQRAHVSGSTWEICDGKDNDCDGSIDEDFPTKGQSCDGTDSDLCKNGTLTCNTAGTGVECVNESPVNIPEVCDFTDNDCDGSVDEGFNLGAECDGPDSDSCGDDGEIVCNLATGGTKCEDRGPATWFTFDRGTGSVVHDMTGNGHDGTAYSTTWTTVRKYGPYGMYFDGSDRVDFPSAGMQPQTGTISVWLRPSFNGTDTAPRGVFQTQNGVNNPGWISLFKWYGNIFYFRIVPSAGCCGNDLTIPASQIFSSGSWVHLAATWNQADGSMRIFVNGVQRGYRTGVNFAIPAASATSRVGWGHDTAYLGYLDDFTVYGYALSQAEIQAISGSGASGNYATVMAKYADYEVCDGADNNCKSGADEGWDKSACTMGVGGCANTGAKVCVADGFGTSCNVTGKPSGTTCTDGGLCTKNDACTGGDSSYCLGTPYTCDDGLACTSNVCNGTGGCSYPVVGNFCAIGGQCIAGGTINNQCQVCNPAVSTTSWSNVANGTGCNADSNGCTVSDTCQSGVCTAGAAPSCNDSKTCTTDTCSSTGAGTYTCVNTVNSGSCLIGGTCYTNGQTNPANQCQQCTSATTNVTTWSSKANGTSCNADSNGCTQSDSCSAGVCTTGTTITCNDSKTCTTDTCNSSGATTYSCTNTVNSGSCLVAGTCYSNGQTNPANQCQQCTSATTNVTSWSNKSNGTSCNADSNGCTVNDTCQTGVCAAGAAPSCNDSKTCTTDTCSSTGAGTYTCVNSINNGTCLISGTCFADGNTNGGNQCERCWSASSKTVWSSKPNGTACNDGSSCTSPDTCSSGTCVGATAPEIGQACDGPDTDACTDGVKVCQGTSVVCRDNGAGVYLKLHEGTGTVASDWSGNGHNGTLVNGAQWVPGWAGNGIRFDGANDYIEVPHSAHIQPDDAITVAMWVNPNGGISCDSNNNWRWLAAKGAWGSYNLIFEQNYSIGWTVRVNGADQRLWTGGNVAPAGVWTHVAFTYDAKTGAQKTWINGTLNTQAAKATGTMNADPNPLRIGAWGAAGCQSGSGAFPGAVDEVFVFGRELTSGEIAGLATGDAPALLVNRESCDGIDNDCDGSTDEGYSGKGAGCDTTADTDLCSDMVGVCANEGTTVSCKSGPKHAWPFLEGSGVTAKDSGIGKDLALVNGATWAAGKSDTALSLDGSNDYAWHPGWAQFSGMSEMTISAWIRPTATGALQEIITSSGHGDANGCCWRWQMWRDGAGKIRFALWDGDSSEIVSSVAAPANAWTHVVATLKVGGFDQIYVNGQLSGGKSAITSNGSFGYLHVGAIHWNGTPQQVFPGQIDEVSIFDYEMEASEVAWLYQQSKLPSSQVNFEYCDGIDNDCDGLTDEGHTFGACDGPDSDLCKNGLLQCTPDKLSTVCGTESPTNIVEKCNGIDDDCDGQTDETWPSLGQTCDGPDSDLCKNGTIICATATTTTCSAESPTNIVEKCNGIDDDCDGTTDEGFPVGQACDGPDSDLCAYGTYTCKTDGTGVQCVNESPTNVAEKCNGLDDDCDGSIDETFTTLGQACDGTDGDLCKNGTFTCNGAGTGVQCVNESPANITEKCNGIDDDCDGSTDEGFALGVSCDTADPDSCKEGVTQCTASGTGTECAGEPVAYFKFDEGTGATAFDASSYGNHGTLVGATWTAGKTGGGLAFNGSQWVDVGNAASVQITTPGITMAAWVKWNGTGGENIIVNKESTYEAAVISGVFRCAINPANGGWYWSGSGAVAANVWTHVACTYGPDDQIRTYVGGVLKSTQANSGGNVVGSGSPLLIGRRGGGSYFYGALDEVAVFNVALTGAKIASMAGSGLPASANHEYCDGVDNDCDGTTDEGFATKGQACDSGDSDLCKNGTFTCTASGIAVECVNESPVNIVEKCNGIDDDCDGSTDETYPLKGQTCDGADSDFCKNGTYTCTATGAGVECVNESPANIVEKCNGLDDDCDGAIDETFPTKGQVCDGSDSDLCKNGTLTCTAAGTGVECVNETVVNIVDICNGVDDDCDGSIDEGFDKSACTMGVGACANTGVKVCKADGTGTECNVTGKPTTTVCNDGNSCTKTDRCTGGSTSACAGQAYTCNDSLSCTTDSCDGDGTCTFTTNSGFCKIGGACFGEGAVNPAAQCQICQTATSNSAWTAKPNGTLCNADNNGCTFRDVCSSGSCVAGATPVCKDGVACTTDACVSTGASTYACSNPVQSGKCRIGSITKVNATAFTSSSGSCTGTASSAPPDLACDDGCTAGCSTGSRYDYAMTTVVGNTYDVVAKYADYQHNCAETVVIGIYVNGGLKLTYTGTGTNDWAYPSTSFTATGTTTTISLKLENDACCGCSGTCKPAAACPVLSTDVNLYVDDLTLVDTTDGPCWTSGTQNPDNQCQLCTPATTQTAWSSKTNGTVCNDGTDCTVSDACASGNCQGTPAPSLGNACDGPDTDLCKNGAIQCAASGTTLECGPESVTNITEKCNGIDDDCDGQTDETFPLKGQTCDSTDTDFCKNGTYTCKADGSGVECINESPANIAELCNAADDDCDGQTDEDFPTKGQTCDSADSDLCKNGTYTCKANGSGVECVNESPVNIVEKCNGVDDDCDGQTDENFTTLGDPCDGSDSDQCKNGSFTCKADGTGVQCVNESVTNITEKCNAIDDDCDGQTDEDFPTKGAVCDGGDDDVCKLGTFTCKANGSGVECVNDGPVALYKFEEGAGTSAATSSGQVGSAALSGTSWTTGPAGHGKALTMGGGTAAVANHATLAITSKLTLMGWVKWSGGGVLYQHIVDKGNGTSYTMFALGTTGELYIKFNNWQVPMGTLQAGQWTHVAATFDGGAVKGYVNGLQTLSTTASTTAIGVTAKALDIGSAGSAASGFNGSIDEVAIYASALTRDKVVALMLAGEACNGADDDCDGATDEPFTAKGADCDGADSDLCENGTFTCAPTTVALECVNETVTNIVEICNGIDDDCDGLTDEGFLWSGIGVGAACNGTGECGIGVVQCKSTSAATCSTNPDGTASQAQPEICDSKDNDCDGLTDEGFAYVQQNGTSRTIGQSCDGIGECGIGSVQCATTTTATCSTDPNGTASQAQPEVCDSKDNDCDTLVDEDFTYAQEDGATKKVGQACDGVGECGAGTVECTSAGAAAICSTDPAGSDDESEPELCDGLDNSCNGATDEGYVYQGQPIGGPCDGIGACGIGTVECRGTGDAACSTEPAGSQDQSKPETCNGLDDDCDGLTDEGASGQPLTQACYTGPSGTKDVGLCKGGTATCGSGTFGACIGQVLPKPNDSVCDGKDENCNGAVDEHYAPVSCGIGACANTSACVSGAVVSCAPKPTTGDDTDCDGIDDDCDGAVDEHFVATVYGQGVCACSSTCSGGVESACTPSAPPLAQDTTCNGLDDDCDGQTDESYTDFIACTVDTCVAGEATSVPNHGACNDANPCTDDACNVSAGGCVSTADDTNTPDPTKADANLCTDLICANGSSVNVNDDTNVPDDGLSCTDDTCTAGADAHELHSDACLIDGLCWAAGDVDPADGCSVCAPGVSQVSWSNTVFEASFDDGTLSGMTATVLDGSLVTWQADNERSVSPSHAAYFGDPVSHTYDFGRVHARLETPALPLASNVMHRLRFQVWMDTEGFTASSDYDALVVSAVTDGGASVTELWNSTDALLGTTGGGWRKVDVNLDPSAFGGEQVTIRLEFDSGDDAFNAFEGVYVDDLRLGTACCFGPGDCEDGDPCTDDFCNAGSCDFTYLCDPQCVPSGNNVVVLLDRSQSMGDSDGMMTKFDWATDALDTTLGSYDSVLNFGLKVFPSSGVCAVSPTLDVGFHATQEQISLFLATVSPDTGGSPVSLAVTTAGQLLSALPYGGQDTVVLVTDGGAGCVENPDRVAAVEQLAAAGIEVIVIGYGYTPADEATLDAMALAGGVPKPRASNDDRYFYDAKNATQLLDQIDAALGVVSAERCDGIDNDCDGEVDENVAPIACNPHCGIGGKRMCEGGTWGDCSVVPTTEVCDGIDNDCDAAVDEDWYAHPTKPLGGDCTNGKLGECIAWGSYICDSGDPAGPAVCSAPDIAPTPEVCDGKDNNCNGIVDDGLSKACSTACGTGVETCSAGVWINCTAPPVLEEVCNNIDDDCDGVKDEAPDGQALTQLCGTACGPGVETCKSGQWKDCTAQVPIDEDCNGLDDDCDGKIDEGVAPGQDLEAECYSGGAGIGVGECHGGTKTCQPNGTWGPCVDEQVPVAETCDGADNDCDGVIDEDESGVALAQECNDGPGYGICTSGLEFCENGGWGECIGSVLPQPETCDGLDNDCDGVSDEEAGATFCKSQPGCYSGNCKCAKDFYGNYKCFLD